MEVASVGRRVTATMVDAFLTVALVSPLWFKMLQYSFGDRPVPEALGWGQLGVFLVYTLVELLTARSWGKRMLGLYIVGPNGSGVSLTRRAVRWLAKYTPIWTICLAPIAADFGVLRQHVHESVFAFTVGIGAILPLISLLCMLRLKGRSLHDFVSNTCVVSGERESRGFPVIFGPTSAEGGP